MADINRIIEQNMGLVYQQLHRFKLVDNPDAESYANEAIYNAALTYKPETGNTFSTYATCVIANSLRMYLRSKKKKRQLTIVSYNAPVTVSDEDTVELCDTLASDDTAEDIVISNELSEHVRAALRTVYNELTTDSHKKIFRLWCANNGNIRQREIAEQLNLSQPYVSRAISIIRYKLRQQLEDYL